MKMSLNKYIVISAVTEEQSCEDDDTSDDDNEDEGIDTEDAAVQPGADDPIDCVNHKFAVLTTTEQVAEEDSPALQDVLMPPGPLHLPGFEEVERLALVLVDLADDSDRHIVSASMRQRIATAASHLKEHDKSSKKFVREYQSKWGYTLFGRCLGPDSPSKSAAQKTRFSTRYAPAVQITQDSRLLYLAIKMLKNRPPASRHSSPTKAAADILGQYKRIVDRVHDDPQLCGLNIPLPNINAKSITTFITKEQKRSNYRATVLPKSKPRTKVLSATPLPEAPSLPASLPIPDRPQTQYDITPHLSGKRRGEKRRLDFEESETVQGQASTSSARGSATASSNQVSQIYPRPCIQSVPQDASVAPVLLVVPSQPKAPSISLVQPGSNIVYVPPPPVPSSVKSMLPKKASKPCAACKVPNCGGLRKRYQPLKEKVEGSQQRIFTFCPSTRRSLTPGFTESAYENFEHFKRAVDEELARRKDTM